MTAEQIAARIEGGCFGAGFSARVESRTETVDHVHVTRYGRQQRGYVRVEDGGEVVDTDQLDIAGIADRNLLAVLTGEVQS